MLRICSGPGQSLIGVTPMGFYRALQLQWNKDKEELSIVKYVPTQLEDLRELCYIEKYDLLVSTFMDPGTIQAVGLRGRSRVWTNNAGNESIQPEGLCCNPKGNTFLCDIKKECLLCLHGKTGELLQVLLQNEIGKIYNVCWSSTAPELTVLHADGWISCHAVNTIDTVEVVHKS